MTTGHFTGPDFDFRWPNDLFADELELLLKKPGKSGIPQFDRLLGEAFTGDVSRHVRSLPDNPFELLLRAAGNGELGPAPARPPRWKQRKGLDETEDADVVHELRAQFVVLLRELNGHGYFDHLEDVAETAEEELGASINLRFIARTIDWSVVNQADFDPERDRMEHPPIKDLADDDLYELFEIFDDLVARPRHFYDGRYSEFSFEAGRRLYRWKVNQLLERNAVALRLGDSGHLAGRLVEQTDAARTDLLKDVVANASESERSDIEVALDQFRKRAATSSQKRSAVIALAGILEKHRTYLKDELLSKDEGALFDIANNFAIRHQNERQRPDYDPAFLDWTFWWYLATIDLIQRLVERQQATTP